ncbi:hypothetical protein GCM10027614_82260 [Micromonospora vulcania]
MTTYDELVALRQPQRAAVLAATIGDLDQGVPLVLLPVRLETRYDTDPASTRLRIRVYPDDIHLDAHEPELTDAEAEAGRAYWRACWTAAEQPDRQRAWTLLVTSVGPSGPPGSAVRSPRSTRARIRSRCSRATPPAPAGGPEPYAPSCCRTAGGPRRGAAASASPPPPAASSAAPCRPARTRPTPAAA